MSWIVKISESNIFFASAKINFLIIGYRNGYNFIRKYDNESSKHH